MLVTRITPVAPITLAPPKRPVWDELGWTMKQEGAQTVYTGQYHTLNTTTRQPQTFDGRVVVNGDHIQAWVSNPPPGLNQHAKSSCFARNRDDWFTVNWATPPTNADDAILYVQRVMDESVNGIRSHIR